MKSMPTASAKGNPAVPEFWVTFTLLSVVLSAIFLRSFASGSVLFSNDGPLGATTASAAQPPGTFTGWWMDLNWLGYEMPSAPPGITNFLKLILGPVLFAKFFAPIVLLIVGLAGWMLFRQLKLGPIACTVGAIAVALNSSNFSTACWGMGLHTLTWAWSLMALAALADDASPKRWIRVVLAGFCVGMGIMEGFDIGAIFSLVVAAFVVCQACFREQPLVNKLTNGAIRTALVAVCAALLAAQTVTVLVRTQIQGVAGTEQDSRSKEENWDWATQWSLPKSEVLQFFVPGLFGYRMDTPNGGQYWGAMGRDPAWDRYFKSGRQGPQPGGFIRYSGGGAYAGVLVVLVALWAFLQSFRGTNSIFTPLQRKWLKFWSALAFVSLLLAFGRFAPFYKLLYSLPYFSTIRNPAKFVHLVSLSLLILFAYGVHGLTKRYLEGSLSNAGSFKGRLKNWWNGAPAFDKRWTVGCAAAAAISLLGWLIYSSSKPELAKHLQTVQFDVSAANSVASFSVRQVGWFVLFLVLSVGAITLILSGTFSGRRARWAAIVLGLIVVSDLTLANRPWIVYWNYPQKYASNPVIDLLRDKPYEHRVANLPRWFLYMFRVPEQLAGRQQFFDQLYGIEWTQHLFLYYNVQTLDIIQMPRQPEDKVAFDRALQFSGTPESLPLVTRQWELTNTRYLLGTAAFLEVLNEHFDPAQKRFRIEKRFDIVPKAGVTQPTRLEELSATFSTNGQYALFEFTGALPRAKLYADWEVITNQQVLLERLASKEWDPEESVLIGAPLSMSPPESTTNLSPGKVEFINYAPKHFVLNAEAGAPSILLVNDKFDSNWKVKVDGEPADVFRANYIMRGVYLEPGTHVVDFSFAPETTGLFVSMGAMAVGLVLVGFLVVSSKKGVPSEASEVGATNGRPGKPASKSG